MEPSELDVRSIPNAERLNRFLTAFDRLLPGTSLVLLTNSEPKDVLRALHDERPTLFEWNPISRSDGDFRIQITRRRDGTHRTVTDFVASAHRRLVAMLESLADLLKNDQLDDARGRLPMLLFAVDREFRIEEEIFYAAYATVTDFSAEPLAFFRGEHRVMRVLLAQIADAIETGEVPQAQAAVYDLIEVMVPHCSEEGQMVLQALDQRLSTVDELILDAQAQ